MVAQNIRLPNIRRMLRPDPGYTIVDADLAGADAQVVAWEAGDEPLKELFRKGLKVHVHNARTIWPDRTRDMTDEEIKSTGDAGGMYYEIKRAVHGTNYGASPGALVAALGWTVSRAQEFQERWFFHHPLIRQWHNRYEAYLDGTRCWNCDCQDGVPRGICPTCGVKMGSTVKNAFGFRRIYFDRVDGSLLPEALAWTPQSTVAFAVELGWTSVAMGSRWLDQLSLSERVMRDWTRYLVNPQSHAKWYDVCQFLVQVHDSIVFQVPYEYEHNINEIVTDFGVKIPYPDELIIPMSWKSSRISWGDC